MRARAHTDGQRKREREGGGCVKVASLFSERPYGFIPGGIRGCHVVFYEHRT